MQQLTEAGPPTRIAEPERKRQRWAGQRTAQAALYANPRRLQTEAAKALMRRRGERMERSFAHLHETGGMRRVHLRGKDNLARRLLIHAAAFNLSLILRQMLRAGTARQAAELLTALCLWFLRPMQAANRAPPWLWDRAGLRTRQLIRRVATTHPCTAKKWLDPRADSYPGIPLQ